MTRPILQHLPPVDLNDPTLYTASISEAAVILRSGENAVRRLIADGDLTAVRVGSRSVRVTAASLRQYLGLS